MSVSPVSPPAVVTEAAPLETVLFYSFRTKGHAFYCTSSDLDSLLHHCQLGHRLLLVFGRFCHDCLCASVPMCVCLSIKRDRDQGNFSQTHMFCRRNGVNCVRSTPPLLSHITAFGRNPPRREAPLNVCKSH